ncbi:transcription factor bHLH162-like isoform X2 [Punica granatum]|uniref:BHLH domain-containing protein n=2 Tax=Punica granatum TaxID=22663 RepID=A0A218VZD6_PUNGR|nr:transcription factor bHLH162-like isoform X2 [Punica granatum]OWM65391.1 hypothetical protein CDL15_Pgr008981 [Punica granatum]PKI56959.1 hypothetical protein CRG98_022633 [Punica granatum]
MKKCNTDSPKPDRKTVERNRRIHMKGLCFKLASLIPPQHYKTSKDMLSQQDQLDFAAAYIKQLRDRIDGLKRRKELAMISNGLNCSGNGGSPNPMANVGVKLPVIELREWESGLEVSLISGVDKNFMLYEVISILHEEGAEVVSASFSTIGDKIFHTLHAQVRISRVGIETSRIWERLQELTC